MHATYYNIAVLEMGKMSKEDAARIQSHADRTGANQGFKERAQSAADKKR